MRKLLIALLLVSILLPSIVFASTVEEEKIVGSYPDWWKTFVSKYNYLVTKTGNEVTVNYLTTQFCESTILVTNMKTNEENLVVDDNVVTYHTVVIELEPGIYSIQPLAKHSNGVVTVVIIK